MASTTTMEKISEALNLVDAKKESLRKAFLELESQSSCINSFSITWPNLDSHFSAIQSSLLSQFTNLKSQQSAIQIVAEAQPALKAVSEQPESSARAEFRQARIEKVSREVRPEIKALCEKMDGKGLRKYINDHHKELNTIRQELPSAFGFCSDPGMIVLDALEGFYNVNARSGRKGDKDFHPTDVRRTCVVLLEELMNGVGVEGIGSEARQKAKDLAVEWKGKVRREGVDALEVLGFLTLVASYGLVSEFDCDWIGGLFVDTARFRETISLCRMLVVPDKIPDVVQKLIDADKQLVAVKLTFEFGLADKFPPVPLLKAYVKVVKQQSVAARNKGNHSRQAVNEAASKEINALKTVMKYIEDFKLESEYPKSVLEKRIEEIKNHKNNKKRPATDMIAENKQYQLHKQLKGQQQLRNTAVQNHLGNVHPSLLSYQPPALLPTSGLMQDHNAQYMSTLVHPYGSAGSSNQSVTHYAASSTVTPYLTLNPNIVGFSGSNPNVGQYLGNQDVALYSGSTPKVDPYGSSLTGLYSISGASVAQPANPSPKSSNIYGQDSQLPSAYYNTATAYGGGGYSLPPHYQPPYYPQIQ